MSKAPPESRPRRIVLVGMAGCGKSTVAAELARRLGWVCIDMDRRLEQEAGKSLRELFADAGEDAFRRRELALARELSASDNVVVAAGGGAFAREDTREALRSAALTVWLRCDIATIFDRVKMDGSRPLATDRETIARLMQEREPFYRLADCTVNAARAPEVVAREIEEVLSRVRPQA